MSQQTQKPLTRKIWREAKRPFRQGWLIVRSGWKRFDRIFRGMSRKEYKHYCEQKTWRKNVKIRENGMLEIPITQFYLANGCNLKCEFCELFNPFRSGIVPKEILIDSIEKWSHKILPRRVDLLGGEPLLNSSIAEVIIAVHRCFPQASYQVITNGILLPDISDDILSCFKKHNVTIAISQHLDTEEYRNILKESLSRLEQFGTRYIVHPALKRWRKHYNLDSHGVPIPYSSNPKKAYNNCVLYRCSTIVGDYLYRCSALAQMIMSVQEKALPPEWDRVISHKPVTFESSPEEIRDYLRGGGGGGQLQNVRFVQKIMKWSNHGNYQCQKSN